MPLRTLRHFVDTLDTAYGSAVETGELLEHALATEALPAPALEPIIERNRLCQRLTYGLLPSVKRKSARKPVQPESGAAAT